MTQTIFEERLEDLNRMMSKQTRKILLLVDNATRQDKRDEQRNSEIPSTKSDISSSTFRPGNQTSCKSMIPPANVTVYIVTTAETNNTKSVFNKSVTVLHAVRWLSSAWEQISRGTTVKCFQRAGFNNHQEKNEDCEEHMGLNQATCCLLLDVQKDISLVDEIESNDTDFIVHEEVPSIPDEVLEDIFKEIEEKKQDSHCENSDNDDNSDVANTNNSRPLPSHKEALQCVSQLITCSSAHQPQFIGDLFHLYNSIEWQWIAANMMTRQSKINEYFSPNE
jgi:hypothetical protein